MGFRRGGDEQGNRKELVQHPTDNDDYEIRAGFLEEAFVGRSLPGRGNSTCKVPRWRANPEGFKVMSLKP